MSASPGSKVISDIWPVLLSSVEDKADRIDLLKPLLKGLMAKGVDLSEVASIHEDINEAIEQLLS